MHFQRYSAVSLHRLRPDGSVDRDYYRRVAHLQRRQDQLRFLAALGRVAWRAAAACVRTARARIVAALRARDRAMSSR